MKYLYMFVFLAIVGIHNIAEAYASNRLQAVGFLHKNIYVEYCIKESDISELVKNISNNPTNYNFELRTNGQAEEFESMFITMIRVYGFCPNRSSSTNFKTL